MSFLCIITLRNKTVALTFLPSTKQMAVSVKKILLRFGNFAAVVTLETRRELESKCFSQLFLGSLLMTCLSVIGLFFSCSL